MPDLLIMRIVKMKLHIISILFFITILNCSSQSLNQYKEQINKYLAQEDYYAAYVDILEALKYETEMDSFQMLAGITAFNLNAFSKTTKHLKSIIDKPIVERHPEIDFYLAESQFYQGFYSEALIYFKSYLASTVSDGEMSTKVQKRIESVNWAKENLKYKDPLISIKKLDAPINTKENEFSPFFNDSSLYITSQNTYEKSKRGKISKNSGQILKFNEKTLEAQELDKSFSEEGVHMAHPCLNADKSKLFFTVCNYAENSTTLHCDLYVKLKTPKGWTPKLKLPDPVNRVNYSSTQPSISIDPETKLEKLFFSSNRPGGQGGFDIYAVLLNDTNDPSQVENLEYINTAENEFSPFFNSHENTLFFSSKGHKGFGGLDIYKYAYAGKESNQIINLGPSINSSYDDLYYFENSQARKAYMVSNKPASSFIDEDIQACCYDIYKVKYTPATIELIVNTYDKYDSTPLRNVQIFIKDITESDSLIYSTNLTDKSNLNYKITEDRKYRIIAAKDNWISDTTYCSAIDLEDFSPITRNLYLVERKQLNAFTFEKTTNANLKGVTVELWDLDHNKLIKSIVNPDSNFFNFELLKGTKYNLMAKKNKYESASVSISPLETSLEPILKRNLYLELAAIAELRKLLPIRLFFENDMPDLRSQSDTTSVGFLDIYNDYFDKKSKYIYEFTHKMKGSKKDQAILEIDTFFNQNIRANAEKLKLFMEKLIIILEEGHEIDIFLKGFASPRAKSDYNQHLSSRRVTSVRNEFDRYNEHVFHDYIKNKNFKIKEVPFGESLSSGDVSDSLDDTRNSIYNLKAAYERRVEILEILKGVEE